MTRVREVLNSDLHLSVRLVALTLIILKSTVHEIVTNNSQTRKLYDSETKRQSAEWHTSEFPRPK